jgi:hypothetical protein
MSSKEKKMTNVFVLAKKIEIIAKKIVSEDKLKKEIIGYRIVDVKKQQIGEIYKVIGEPGSVQRVVSEKNAKSRANRRIDKLNNEYGSYRYFVEVVYSK